jgi:hypothetical protein
VKVTKISRSKGAWPGSLQLRSHLVEVHTPCEFRKVKMASVSLDLGEVIRNCDTV